MYLAILTSQETWKLLTRFAGSDAYLNSIGKVREYGIDLVEPSNDRYCIRARISIPLCHNDS